MSRAWKPGDVAMVTCSDGKERVALCGKRFIDDSLVWLFRDHSLRDVDNSSARPLVVIDPEDREQVERLARIVWDQPLNLEGEDVFQAALRQFADPRPPKLAEPTGLGAVVEDANGLRYVRTDWASAPWCGSDHSTTWAAVDVVKVLSEGVTA